MFNNYNDKYIFVSLRMKTTISYTEIRQIENRVKIPSKNG